MKVNSANFSCNGAEHEKTAKLFQPKSCGMAGFFVPLQRNERQGIQMNFESLVGHINQVQDVLQAQAAHAVNLSLTARNWLVGYYIVEYEQHGEDRAK